MSSSESSEKVTFDRFLHDKKAPVSIFLTFEGIESEVN